MEYIDNDNEYNYLHIQEQHNIHLKSSLEFRL